MQTKACGGWIRSVGFLFAACTVIPIVVGLHVGSRFDHEVAGAMIGVAVGLVLAIWIVIRPLWIEADRSQRDRQGDDK